MPTVNLILVTSKNPSNIYVRFTNGRAMNYTRATGVMINPVHWNPKTQQIKNVLAVPNRDEINSKLSRLKIEILDAYNLSFMNGGIISAIWLENEISKFFNRPKGEVKKVNNDKDIYLTDFADWWLKEKAPKWKVKAGKYLDAKTKAHYKILNDIVKRFEGKNKIQLKNITSEVLDEFSRFLSDEGYAHVTAKRFIGRVKFFCERAVAENLEVNMNYKSKVFVAEEEDDYLHPYLNMEEITRIWKHDFSYNESLDNARDLFLVGLGTGLRVSDFLRRLDTSNFKDGFISIKTAKTGASVSIPVNKIITSVLNKRNGELPRKISDQKFNDYIKIICQIVEIDNVIPGAIIKVDADTKVKRKEFGHYEKYLLVTSHICRRSLATNLHGKIPNSDIMSILGWSSEKQFLHYVKKTNMESAIVLQKHWQETDII